MFCALRRPRGAEMRRSLLTLLLAAPLCAQTGTWTLVQTASSPSARNEYAAAYDSVRHRLALFGGVPACSGPRLTDTWEYDGLNWVQRFPATSPTAARGAAVYDSARQRTVLLLQGSS